MTTLSSGIDLQIFFSSSATAVPAIIEHEYLALMPAGVRAALSRYKRWQDRQLTLFGKLLLLKALRRQFHEIGMQKFQSLEVSPYGKPFIPGGPEFNISHSGDMVVLAVMQNGTVGIDIEEVRPVKLEDFSLYLPEVVWLCEKYGAEHAYRLFFDCWTRKEAVLKGYGKGLSVPMEQVVLNEDGMARCYGTRWVLKKLSLDAGYCCHLATDQPLEHVTVERVNLMNGMHSSL